MKPTLLLALLSLLFWRCSSHSGPARQISLNGTWEITKTDTPAPLPSAFGSRVQVPGLVDMAVPPLDANHLYDHGIYWYKTSFTIEEAYPDLVRLKIGKAKYHAWIFLNRQFAGEQLYCFTPGTFKITQFLNPPGETNELIIGIGCVSQMPDTVMWGQDFEKTAYIPGIYDDVTIILGGNSSIENIQTVPLIDESQVRIVADIEEGEGKPVRLSYVIKELASGRVVAKGRSELPDFEVPIPGCRLWTPESPFLYELMLSTGTDEKRVRFGMRSFSFDPGTGRALLNGKPYFMRGTNVCILRFFEDPSRKGLPWDGQWAVTLHQRFKEMHWNSIRYCIGFPPERWYEIADSLGFLIQDEYPVWTSYSQEKIYPKITEAHLANEYRAWMAERCNHPCVVIWDAQNESVTPVTGRAIGLVRGMDLSDRPWENGWSAPQREGDPVESHPYLFSRYMGDEKPSEKGALYDLLSTARVPGNDASQHDPPRDKERYASPIIINEYGWLWLNRDGSTTTLTDRVYDAVFGPGLTREQRLHAYARTLGMLTEYWRAHRMCAGVLHFCGLGYSRPTEPRGQTSDHFIDIGNLQYEPGFVKYVKPAFSPVGIMINFWENSAPAGEMKKVEIYAINDMETLWEGGLSLAVKKGEQEITALKADVKIGGFGQLIHVFEIEIPSEPGDYELVAELEYEGEPVKSIREFCIAGI